MNCSEEMLMVRYREATRTRPRRSLALPNVIKSLFLLLFQSSSSQKETGRYH